MESSPLTLAHSHARNAQSETRKANPVAASEEHDLAAGEFATAAHKSVDPEALRTLQLLEQHHKKLAHLLRFQHEHPSSIAPPDTSSQRPTPQVVTPEPIAIKSSAPAPTVESYQQPPRLSVHNRPVQRDATTSIASNLASARGIPANPRRGSPVSPTLSAQHAGAKLVASPSSRPRGALNRPTEGSEQSSRERPPRITTSKQPWSPPVVSPTEVTSKQVVPPEASSRALPIGRGDEPFQRFYSTFEGLISKLSAPLAFAGLPLGTESPPQDVSNRKSAVADAKVDRRSATSKHQSSQSIAEPDVNKLFSRAALQAARDNAGGLPAGGTTESFYVVPTTGGTVSYAGILSRAGKDSLRSSMDDVDDDFVDARETPASPELVQSFGGAKTRGSDLSRSNRGSSEQPRVMKTMEELQMENQALKHLSDTLSKRLHMWEVNAQSSSLALQQSLRAMHHQNSPSSSAAGPAPVPVQVHTAPGSSSPATARATAETDARIKELEELIKQGEKELASIGRENEKLRTVVGRYRDRWERLKNGARERREGVNANGNGNGTNGAPADATGHKTFEGTTQADDEIRADES